MTDPKHPQPCMDAVIMRFWLYHLAAWYGDSDHPDVRVLLTRLDLYIDQCPECQAHLAWLANEVPQPEVLALVELTQPS